MAAVPITTRATPASASARAASALRTPPPACTGTSTAAAMAAISSRFTGSPVRAASRSTVWIQRRAGGHERLGHRHRVVAVDPLAVEVALDELHDLAAAQVDRRVEVHQAAGRRPRSGRRTPGGPPRPVRLDFSGWNWVAHTLSRSTAATTGPP